MNNITASQVADGLLELFPLAIPAADYQVWEAPDGLVSISVWNLESPMPTEAELIAAAEAYQPTKALLECRAKRAARYEAEASVYDLADAETKLASSDPAEQAEGAAQKAAVLAKRLQIKAEIPKPE